MWHCSHRMAIATLSMCSIIHGMSFFHNSHHGVLNLLFGIPRGLHKPHIRVKTTCKPKQLMTPLCLPAQPKSNCTSQIVTRTDCTWLCTACTLAKTQSYQPNAEVHDSAQLYNSRKSATSNKIHWLHAYLRSIGISSKGCLLEEMPQHLQALCSSLTRLLGSSCFT